MLALQLKPTIDIDMLCFIISSDFSICWGEPKQVPLLSGKQCSGPYAKNRDERRDCNTPWRSGPCTNKQDKPTDAPIQVQRNAKIFGFIY